MERTIGDVIRDLRVTSGDDQKTTAMKADVTPQYWNDIERNRRVPPPETLGRIADVFEAEPAALLWTWLRQQVGDEWCDAMWRWRLGDDVAPDPMP